MTGRPLRVSETNRLLTVYTQRHIRGNYSLAKIAQNIKMRADIIT